MYNSEMNNFHCQDQQINLSAQGRGPGHLSSNQQDGAREQLISAKMKFILHPMNFHPAGECCWGIYSSHL